MYSIRQEFGSAATSLNQVAAGFKAIGKRFGWKEGTANLDIGGGRYDAATEYLASLGVENVVFDPFNRTSEANRSAAERARGERFDTVTCNNVLNVIKEPEVRSNTILQCAKALKPEGTAYFTVYEGTGKGNSRQSQSDSWQENRKTASYVDEVKRHFADVERKGQLIVARNPIVEGKESEWFFDPSFTDGVRYSITVSQLKNSGNFQNVVDALSQSDDIEVRQAMPVISASKRDVELLSYAHRPITNRERNLTAQINSEQRRKLTSNAALNKTLQNGFTINDHNTAVANIHALYENAVLLSEGSDRDGNPNLVIRRFAAPFLTEDGIVADAFLTLKESFDKEDSVRIYSLELTEIKMPSERAAANDKSSDYRTDGVNNLIRKREKVKKAIENEAKKLLSDTQLSITSSVEQDAEYMDAVKNGDEVGWNYVSFRDDNIRVDHKWRDGEKVYSIANYPAFHAWTGDWEARDIYGKLHGNPVASVENGVIKVEAGERGVIDAAKRWMSQHPQEPAHTEIGDVVIDVNSMQNSMSHSRYNNKLAVLPILKDAMEKGEYLGALPDWTRSNTEDHYFAAKVKIGGDDKILFIRVLEPKGQDKSLYVHEIYTDDELANKNGGGHVPGMQTGSAIPVKTENHSDFFRKVIRLFYLSNPESTKAVDSNGRPMVVWRRDDELINVYDFSKTQKTDAGWLGKGFYFYGDKGEAERATGYGKHLRGFYIDAKNPYYMSDEEHDFLVNADSKEASADFTERLIEEGYDSVYYNGDLRQEWVVFKPSQIKIADETTYDDNGSPIPSYMRFSESDDNRYSISSSVEQDAEYMDAVKNGDMERAQEMVNKAAKAAGYSPDDSWRMEHRAPNKAAGDVSLADLRGSGLVPSDYFEHPEWYTSSSEERESFYVIKRALDLQEKRMAEGNNRPVGIRVYRGVDKTLNRNESRMRNGDWVTPSRDYAVNEGRMNPGGYRIISQYALLRDLYWDGNSIAELGYDDGENYAYKDTANNIKLLDTVTYDDNGDVIPLSKRFKARNFDPRYSISGTSSEAAEASSDGAFRSGFYTPTEERSIPRMLMPFLLEHPDADALMVRDYLEGEGVRVARDEDAERFLLATVARVGRVRQLKQYHQKPKRPVR